MAQQEGGHSATTVPASGVPNPPRCWSQPLTVGALAFGYFLAYIPFAGLTQGAVDRPASGIDDEVGGLELLPAAAIGVLVGSAGSCARRAGGGASGCARSAAGAAGCRAAMIVAGTAWP